MSKPRGELVLKEFAPLVQADPNRKPVAIVTGAGGLIGHYLVSQAPTSAPEWHVFGLTREHTDLFHHRVTKDIFAELRPKLIIHCAALSRSRDCEADPALAKRLNVDVTAQLAHLARDIPFVFFSTDLVFDGTKGNYREEDPPSPMSVYGETKVQAEQIVLANPNHTVIRTSLNAGVSLTQDRSFVEEMCRAWEAGKTLTLFTDEFRSPIPVTATAKAVWELVGMQRPGLYHLAGAERLSRWEIGQLVAERFRELNPKLKPGSAKKYAGNPRPLDTSLDSSKIQRLLSFPLPRFGEWLATQHLGIS